MQRRPGDLSQFPMFALLHQTTEYYLGKYDSQTFEKDMAELKKQVSGGGFFFFFN